ncbi:DNA-packaging protein [Escherichia coli]|nr:DNA-packaging protein [Escherichia coli]
MTWFDGVDTRCDMQMIIIIILRVLSGDPTGYGAATSRVFAIYEKFPV